MAVAEKFYSNGRNKEFEIKLKDKAGKDTGFVVWVNDMECDAAIEVENAYVAAVTDMNFRHSKVVGEDFITEVPKGERGDLWVKRTQDKYAACICRWDLNGEGVLGDDDTECTYENKINMLKIPGLGDQIRQKIDEISGFTTPLKEG